MEKKPKCSATGKTRYDTPGEAKEAMLRLKGTTRIYDYNTGKRFNRRSGKIAQCRYYRCQHCIGYHLTKQEARMSSRERNKMIKQKIRDTEGLVKNPDEAEKWKADGLPFPEDNKTNNNEMV